LRGIIVIGLLGTSPHLHPTSQRNDQKLTVALMKRTTTPGASEPLEEEKERCSGSYRLAVGFLVIKDESISERPG